MPPRLPLEVLEQIIEDVAADYVDNLSSVKAWALVCHSFLPLCRKHIFASVTLNAHSSATSDDLSNLLSNSPHLAVYIRELDYLVNEKELEISMVAIYVQEIGRVTEAKHNIPPPPPHLDSIGCHHQSEKFSYLSFIFQLSPASVFHHSGILL